MKLDLLTKTIIKSKIVQKLLKYLVKPNAIHFSSISTMNMTQNTRFVQQRIALSLLFLSKCISSKHNVILEAKIRIRTNHSNAGVSTMFSTDVLTSVHFCPSFVFANLNQQGHLIIYWLFSLVFGGIIQMQKDAKEGEYLQEKKRRRGNKAHQLALVRPEHENTYCSQHWCGKQSCGIFGLLLCPKLGNDIGSSYSPCELRRPPTVKSSTYDTKLAQVLPDGFVSPVFREKRVLIRKERHLLTLD